MVYYDRIDFEHLKKAGLTYTQHAKFALSIGINLACSSVWFLVHGGVPFLQIPQSLNLESVSTYLRQKNEERS